jgi:excisionase family DNA binding protein
MEWEVPKDRGWLRIKAAAKYAGVSESTFRRWLRKGLRHSKLPSGMILIHIEAIDEFLESYEVREDIQELLDDALSETGRP